MVLLLLMVGCLDYALTESSRDKDNVEPHIGASSDDGSSSSDQHDDPRDDDDDDGGSGGGSGGSSGGSSGGGSGGSSGGSSGGGGDDDPVSEPGDSASNPRTPTRGDVVINELMIDPDATDDSVGEWVEIYNRTGDWIDLEGARLADDGVDDYEIDPTSSGSLVVEPDGYLVICADDDFWENGGVDCDGTVLYQTWGGGFALSNTGDEVNLLTPSGSELDSVSWGEGFAYVGSSMGVDPDAATVSGNDDLDDWCDEWSFLPQGDYGNPGAPNDWCW